MKTILTLILLAPFAVFSRNYSDDEVLNYMRWGSDYMIGYQWISSVYYYTSADAVKDNNVKQIVSYELKKNGKKVLESTKTYNSKGQLIKMVMEDETIDIVFTNNLLTEIIRTEKTKVTHTFCAYDDQERMTSIRIMKNNELTSETNYVYFEGTNTSIVEQISYKNAKKKKVYRLETDYDPLLKTATESRYTINGKLEKQWTYSCDQKGKEVKSDVEQITECSYSTPNPDGSYTTYSRTMDDDGVYLVEMTYGKDSVMREYKRFYNDTVLVSHQISKDNVTTFESFGKNGKFEYKAIHTYDDRGNRVNYENYNKRQKCTSSMKASYTDKDLVEEVTYASGRGLQFEYAFY